MGWIVLAMVIALQNSAPPPAQRRPDSRTWYQAYADGRRAFQQGNWQAAVDSLEAAKQARGAPKPGRRIPFYGDVYDDYLPDYYLGLAYFNLGQYAAADRALDAMRASGVIGPRDREYAQLDQQSKAAKVALQAANAPAQVPPVQQQTPTSTPPANSANTNPVTPNVTRPADTPPAGTNAGTTPVDTPAGNRGTTAAPTNIQTGGRAPVANANPSSVAPAPPGRGRGISPPRPGVTGPVLMTATPASVVRSLSAAEERAAMTAYLSGQYEQAASALALGVAAGLSPRASFYLACSRAALVILGQADPASFAEARAALQRAGGASQFAMDRKYISPRVLQMIEGTP